MVADSLGEEPGDRPGFQLDTNRRRLLTVDRRSNRGRGQPLDVRGQIRNQSLVRHGSRRRSGREVLRLLSLGEGGVPSCAQSRGKRGRTHKGYQLSAKTFEHIGSKHRFTPFVEAPAEPSPPCIFGLLPKSKEARRPVQMGRRSACLSCPLPGGLADRK